MQSAITTTRARQRGNGVIGQVRYVAGDRVTLDAGVRADWWQLENLTTAADETIDFFAPRAGVTFAITKDVTLRGAYLTGFRTPTMNELYRSFRVGNTTTQANANLDPEKSRGPEVALTVRKDRFTARGIFYATWLDGAIYNKTISSTPTAIVRQRDNGDAKTVGSELELEVRVTNQFALTTGWAINDATFTSGELDGKRTPQVPRASGTIGFRVYARQFTAAANLRLMGDQYDDDRNDFKLDSGSLFDARAGWRWSRRFEVFAGGRERLRPGDRHRQDADPHHRRAPRRACGGHRSVRLIKGGEMERRTFLGALTAPLVIAGVSAQQSVPPAAPAPRKGRLKQGVTRGVFARNVSLEDCAAKRRSSGSRAST